MTTINEQNAKQIRKPMEVYVRMDLSDKSITMTYSGYSSAKIADGKLDQTDWKMRRITDLQGDGYPLDSSCTLYNPNTTASASNGKIGVRGNIGEPVSVTITGSSVMDSVTIMVTGASSVSHDGGTSTISGSTVIVSIEASTTTLTFTPKSADRRVEISDIIPGVMFNVTNENMISCTLSLRADLSIVDPTLPESEMNLEFYNDEDISETLAAIPEDTPITYRAGYDGDLSPERKFYVAGQVTYKDNVISVHAVDAVHFFDKPLNAWVSFSNHSWYPFVRNYSRAVCKIIIGNRTDPGFGDSSGYLLAPPEMTFREAIAGLIWAFRSNETDEVTFWSSYVDAGIPFLTNVRPSASHTILEADCGDIIRSIDYLPSGYIVNCTRVTRGFSDSIGSATLVNGVGVSVNYDEVAAGSTAIGIKTADSGDFTIHDKLAPQFPEGVIATWMFTMPVIPMNKDGQYAAGTILIGGGSMCNGPGTTSQGLIGLDNYEVIRNNYAQFVPWDAYYDPTSLYFDQWPTPLRSMASLWSQMKNVGLISGETNTYDLNIIGSAYSRDEYTFNLGEYTEHNEISAPFLGQVSAAMTHGDPLVEIYPKPAFEHAWESSRNTGSFTWKGDPRMQPRDVFTFVKLDGTEIDCTIEQIDLEHVGGGTTARITYREGIV